MSSIRLPSHCGVMLLPDCTLFPHGGLPLHIFEPRYREMLAEALAGDCIFAVGRLAGAEIGPPENFSPLIGTAGLIRASREHEDGTSHTLLHGVLRVRFLEWVGGKSYPCAAIEPVFSSFEPENQAEAAMKTLRGAVEDAMRELPGKIQTDVLSLLDRADEPGLMADIICQQFIHEPDLRQQLLEMEAIGDRIPLICAFLDKVRMRAEDE